MTRIEKKNFTLATAIIYSIVSFSIGLMYWVTAFFVKKVGTIDIIMTSTLIGFLPTCFLISWKKQKQKNNGNEK